MALAAMFNFQITNMLMVIQVTLLRSLILFGQILREKKTDDDEHKILTIHNKGLFGKMS